MLTQHEEDVIQNFKDEMHLILLQKSTEKISWLSPEIPIGDLFVKFTEEVGEVFVEGAKEPSKQRTIKVKKELIDVANLCMMLWSRL